MSRCLIAPNSLPNRHVMQCTWVQPWCTCSGQYIPSCSCSGSVRRKILVPLAVSSKEAATQRPPLSSRSQMGLVTQDSGPEFGSSSLPGEMHAWCATGVLPALGGMLSRALDMCAKSNISIHSAYGQPSSSPSAQHLPHVQACTESFPHGPSAHPRNSIRGWAKRARRRSGMK